MATLGETSRPAYVYDSGTDTWIPVGIGPHSHDPSAINAVASTTFDAKGDLLGGTGADTYTKLAVGNNGDTLLADSTQTTGLRWGNNLGFTAGKNKIINGDFNIWQRGTSFSTSGGYAADRWVLSSDATFTVSRQSFTAGTAPVAGYESQYFFRYAKNSGGTYATVAQRIEDVRTFANSTVTLSLWAKADAAETLTVNLNQNFGSGGSTQVNLTAQSASITTSWARYSFTFTVPSISGKTVGTSSYLNTDIYVATTGARTFDIWGVQLEAGSVATAFQTATGTIQGELAACQRYYVRLGQTSNVYARIGSGIITTSTIVQAWVALPTQMRVLPTAVEFSTVAAINNTVYTISNLTLNASSVTCGGLECTISGGTVNQPVYISQNNSTSGYLAFSAEL